MDIPALAQKDDVATTVGAGDNTNTTAFPGDPLAGMALDGSQSSTTPGESIVPNKTLDTNDESIVGDIASKINNLNNPDPITALRNLVSPSSTKEPEPKPDPSIAPASSVASPAGITEPEIIDPDKENFIKTYTEEFDLTLVRATEAVSQVLVEVDNTIRERLPNITIPREIDEFIDNPPTNHQVEKFDDAQDIVKAIMAKANEAKEQSEAAATEAAKVYDEVQSFKQQTRAEIATLTGDLDVNEVKRRAQEEEAQARSLEKTSSESDPAPSIKNHNHHSTLVNLDDAKPTRGATNRDDETEDA
ncbi:MAG: hypothetical protein WAW91_02625 [Candidatus Nanoperiomorbaceae bacterium]